MHIAIHFFVVVVAKRSHLCSVFIFRLAFSLLGDEIAVNVFAFTPHRTAVYPVICSESLFLADSKRY